MDKIKDLGKKLENMKDDIAENLEDKFDDVKKDISKEADKLKDKAEDYKDKKVDEAKKKLEDVSDDINKKSKIQLIKLENFRRLKGQRFFITFALFLNTTRFPGVYLTPKHLRRVEGLYFKKFVK